jgi:hypothetical protein
MFALIIPKKLSSNRWHAATKAAMNRELLWINNGPRSKEESENRGVTEEIEFIHRANQLYWRRPNPSNAAKADYCRRQDRLNEIRSELAELQQHD